MYCYMSVIIMNLRRSQRLAAHRSLDQLQQIAEGESGDEDNLTENLVMMIQW